MAENGSISPLSPSKQSGDWISILRFFMPLSTREPVARSQALDLISSTIESWLNRSEVLRSESLVENNHNINNINNESMVAMYDYLPNIVRFSINCPFADVRERFAKILDDLQNCGLKIPKAYGQGPSRFIHRKEIIPPDVEDEQSQILYREVFIHNNRLDHMSQVMAFHPKYLEAFLRTQYFLLRGDGPLPYSYRHYIAIMAAGRHQCTYLINLQRQEFLLNGGDDSWLKGLQYIPKKLRDLYEINKILGHRPWLINKGHIEKLTKGADNWSLSELVQAVVILAHFHTLPCFVYGCGITEEIDQDNGHPVTPMPQNEEQSSSSPDSETSADSAVGSTTESVVEVLMQRMQKLSEQIHEETSHEDKVKSFEKVESQAAGLIAGSGPVTKPSADISMFIEDPDYMFQDFARRGEVSDIPTFRVQDYSWDDQGYSLVNSIYNDVGNYLDELFKVTYNLTYYTMGSKKCIDTTVFRRAIWNYIQCIFGIRHDDYDYSEVNQMIERNLKAYIKTICVYPERITKKDYENFMRDFHHSEKVHVNLMVVEARMQAELLYALRAIMQYMT